MARPKKGERGCQEASNKWKQTMLKKYGGKEGLHKRAQELGSIGGKTPTSKPKGFAANHALASIAGAKGGKVSRRTNIKNGEGKRSNKDIEILEHVLEEENGRNR